jgi:putative aldouronate transport system substrate-binding protein
MIIAATSADAAQKLGALIASDDLPDLMFLGPVSGASINNLPEFLAAKCADLTPFLSGDAVKDFPNLSQLPAYVWKAPGGIYDNKLYGVPVAQPVVGNALVTRQEMLDQAGVGPIKSADDFRTALEAVTRPNDDVYGLGDMQGFQLTPYLAAQTFGAPNNWRLDASGKLVKDWETEEFKAGLGYLRDLWAAKLIHPKSLTYTNTTAGNDWAAAKFVFHYWTGGPLDWETGLKVNPNTKMTYTPPFSADGSAKPIFFLGTGNFGATIVKKGTAARVKELLGVLNYSAAPFGSQERLLTYFGIEGADYTLDSDGNPVPTPNGYANNPLPFYYLSRGPAVAFNPTRSRDYATMNHTAEEAEIPVGVQDATLGLYSPSNGSLGASLRQGVADGINDVVAGRVPLSNWDQVVRDWQDKGGHKIRQEFQTALAASA